MKETLVLEGHALRGGSCRDVLGGDLPNKESCPSEPIGEIEAIESDMIMLTEAASSVFRLGKGGILVGRRGGADGYLDQRRTGLTENPSQFAHRLQVVRNVLEHMAAKDEIDAGSREGQTAEVKPNVHLLVTQICRDVSLLEAFSESSS